MYAIRSYYASAVNLIPNNYGRVRELGLFTVEPVRTRTIVLDEVKSYNFV